MVLSCVARTWRLTLTLDTDAEVDGDAKEAAESDLVRGEGSRLFAERAAPQGQREHGCGSSQVVQGHSRRRFPGV